MQEDDSIFFETEQLLSRLSHLTISDSRTDTNMNAETVRTLLETAIVQATNRTKQEFQDTINELSNRLRALEPTALVVEHKPIEIITGVQCDETLDIIKSVPEFRGDANRYVSWRQAAVTAHKLFEPFAGSSKYYQAVAILRNKIIGNADSVLSTYNTVLNFHAIIERLDFAYSDKKSIYTLEQELSTLRQGQKTLLQFYDEVEHKLTAIVNKVLMSHQNDPSLIASFNIKYRQDALRVFISGLRKPLCTTLFSCKPTDLPSALAMAQELETNHNRYHFAEIYSNGLNRDFSTQQQPQRSAYMQNQRNDINRPLNSTYSQPRPQQPHYQANSNRNVRPSSNSQFQTLNFPRTNQQTFAPQPRNHALDTDVSMRTVRTNNFPQAFKRTPESGRFNNDKIQRINHLNEQPPIGGDMEYREQAAGTFEELEDTTFNDNINFLGEDQSSPMSSEQ